MSNLINVVNYIEREIIRSWNWPYKDDIKFSTKPTPYNLSKKLNVPSATVYRYWKSMQENGIMKQLVILPSEKICRRHILVLGNVNEEDFQFLNSIIDDLYFVESIHYFHVFDSIGFDLTGGIKNRGMAIVLHGNSENIARKRMNIVMNSLKNRDSIVIFMSQEQNCSISIPGILEKKVLMSILFKDLSNMDINKLSEEMRMNNRTFRRYLDSIVSKSYIELYPRMDQPRLSEIKVAVFTLFSDLNIGELLSMQLIRDRYLLFRRFSSVWNILLFYETSEELENCIKQLKYICTRFIVSLTFRTSVSSRAKDNFEGMVEWKR